jgi:transcription elongation GreA/GreB family factor
VLGRATLASQPLKPRDGQVSVDAPLAENIKRLAGELVDDVQELQDPPVGGLIELEVKRPHVTRARC